MEQDCGNWQASYAEHHAQILSGQAPQKYLVIQSFSGLADDLALINGMLYIAILTGRALQITQGLGLQEVYDRPNIDWRETQKDESLSQYYEDLGNSGSWPDTSTVQHIRNGSLDDFGNGSAVVVLGGNTGVSALLFDNPRYRPRLMELGMRPENAWRCSMNYMFAPNAEVQEYWKHEFEVMSSDMFKVGIQMRLGDYFLAGPNPGRSRHHRNAEPVLASVQHFLDCAEQLEATYKLPGQEAVWFVISDSVDLRRLALEKYGSKVMTRVMQPSHILAASESEKRNTMFETVGEHWLFGMADYNVVSHMGSFGKTGALRKHSWHNIYRLNIQQVPEPGTVICDGYHTLPLDYGEIARWPPFI